MTEARPTKCRMCAGTGTATANGKKCTRCLGSGLQYRRAPTKRETHQEYLDRMNSMIAETYGTK